jgi:ribosomal protein S17E
LNGKAAKAAEGPEKEAAEAALEKYENELEAKYKDNDAFIKEVQQEAEKCEDASERK